VGPDDHPVVHGGHAGLDEVFRPYHLAHAHPASSPAAQCGMMAERRKIDASLPRGLEDCRAALGLYRLTVDHQLHTVHREHLACWCKEAPGPRSHCEIAPKRHSATHAPHLMHFDVSMA